MKKLILLSLVALIIRQTKITQYFIRFLLKIKITFDPNQGTVY